MSSSCVPCSTMRPFFTTAMLSAFRTVDRRCAMTTVVRFLSVSRRSRASWTTRSDLLSRALVASSRRRIEGSLMSARAIAMRCFWPPLSCEPPCPTCVS
mmetsp:Transcript_20465/g.62307  ORF Transcript_20465/g.62307 Transcript_20465/m.62307 type:complete len:99 (+) Transcript_20465:2343-2639(+)